MIDKLSLLIGFWSGKGTANFPTIEKTEYLEELEFKFIGDDESIMFEQRTWKIQDSEKGTPLHWESGFIIGYPDDTFELLDAQNSKRVEVMKSTVVNIEKTKLQISFESKYFGNDDRMVKTTRDYFVDEESLRFVMKMGTQKTEYQQHLEAVLVRKVS
jgi:hypothetical protein